MRVFFLLFALGIVACQSPSTPPAQPALTVVYPVALREAPDEKSPEILRLATGAELAGINKVSRIVSGIYLNDTLRQEPWLEVQTTKGQKGWVFAGAVCPRDASREEAAAWLREIRCRAWFGDELAARWMDWAGTPQATTDSAFAVYLREGLELRDTLERIIAHSVARDAGQTTPDLFWLGETTPYFIVQQGTNATGYHLYLDYRQVARVASGTRGDQDNLFAQASLAAFPTDSIESALPVWVFPLALDASCSNLGEGYHLRMLQAVERGLRAGPYFKTELLALKDLVLDDILNNRRSYWQPQSKIQAELKLIRAANLQCLSARDRIALEAREKMFETPEKTGIKLNLRSGQ